MIYKASYLWASYRSYKPIIIKLDDTAEQLRNTTWKSKYLSYLLVICNVLRVQMSPLFLSCVWERAQEVCQGLWLVVSEDISALGFRHAGLYGRGLIVQPAAFHNSGFVMQKPFKPGNVSTVQEIIVGNKNNRFIPEILFLTMKIKPPFEVVRLTNLEHWHIWIGFFVPGENINAELLYLRP